MEFVVEEETRDGITSLNLVNNEGDLRLVGMYADPKVAKLFKKILTYIVEEAKPKQLLAELNNLDRQVGAYASKTCEDSSTPTTETPTPEVTSEEESSLI